ncbi:MAG: hypothetical protein EAZ47_05950 [Bacteroidetes bacterium]|jgi:hypothetical protein|nr:MAG: hypothetical protein EAY72_06515 [Bacteroidota bacterium]TAE67633.1 MAG: hypothetical protein EAY68_05230 [Bacteroidota bacterium]TAF93649.1 MAG: hypothetical protein EAZ47_05950 [Bacteroidota bacterium]
MKYSQAIGVAAILFLWASCFMPWITVPVKENLVTLSGVNGRVHEDLTLGKPIIFYMVFGLLSAALFCTPKIWAKRTNIFIAAILLSLTIFYHLSFTFCRQAVCPNLLLGVWLQIPLGLLILTMSLLPKLRVSVK